MKKFIVSICILLFSCQSLANGDKIKIVTSVTPLAAIIAMLVKEQAEIVSIANNNDCPHHYNLKPSDLQKIQNANIIFYVNEQFDGFIEKLVNIHRKNAIKVGSFPNLNILHKNYYNNWHIWLDLHNVKILLEQLAQILIKQFPTININVKNNLEKSIKQIDSLIKIKKEKLSSLSDVILLNDSLEYFFDEKQYKVAKLYNTNQKSLKHISNLEHLLNESSSKCLILSLGQNPVLYKKFKVTVVIVESENWQVEKLSEELFFRQYLKMINQVTKCLNY